MKKQIFLSGIMIGCLFGLFSGVYFSTAYPNPCPNCHLKDSLYQRCNGTISRANMDSSNYIKK